MTLSAFSPVKVGRSSSPPGPVPPIQPGAPEPGVPLGIHREICVPTAKKIRYKRQGQAAKLLPGERVASCKRKVIGSPTVYYRPGREQGQEGSAFYKGLESCGSVWMCPVCASVITEKRRKELSQALQAWPGSVFMVTFTFQHARADKLLELRNYLSDGYRKIKSGHWWQRFESRWGITGSIASHEVTLGQAAGWHPHKHVIFFSSLPVTELSRSAIEESLNSRFNVIMEKMGRYSSSIYGVKVGQAVISQGDKDQAVKQYVAKWGLAEELSKSPVKSGRDDEHYSPFQLLDLAASSPWAAAAFIEYAHAMKGVKQLVWSRGLRKVLGLDQVEKTDETLATESIESGDEKLVTLSTSQWRIIVANDARAELLEVASKGLKEHVYIFLSLLGIDLKIDDT